MVNSPKTRSITAFQNPSQGVVSPKTKSIAAFSKPSTVVDRSKVAVSLLIKASGNHDRANINERINQSNTRKLITV